LRSWSFITNHGAVLALIAQGGRVTARELAIGLGITERSVLRIISDLEAEGYLVRTRNGRVNRYEINHDLPLGRPESSDVVVGDLLKTLVPHWNGDQAFSSDTRQLRLPLEESVP